MVVKFPGCHQDDAVKIRMDITFDLPPEMATQVESLGIYEFDTCIYEEGTKRMKATIETTLYREGA